MPADPTLEGVVPVIPTPFRKDESIDFEALASEIEFAVKCGVRAICLPAYGSEFYKLTEEERRLVVEKAVGAAAGRLAVIAQSNHPSAGKAADLARRHTDLGADLISFAIPRQFAVPMADMLEYCRRICRATSLPILIQDFNPGGATIGAEFAAQLASDCPNFGYLKLEEPLMSAKVKSIQSATAGRIGILEGWGGMYMLDLVNTGICGLMPGLALADVLQRVWRFARGGQMDDALGIFQRVLPQLVFSLQSMELWLHLEKKLLAARGVIPTTSTYVRGPTWTPDAETLAHGLRLNAWAIGESVDRGP